AWAHHLPPLPKKTLKKIFQPFFPTKILPKNTTPPKPQNPPPPPPPPPPPAMTTFPEFQPPNTNATQRARFKGFILNLNCHHRRCVATAGHLSSQESRQRTRGRRDVEFISQSYLPRFPSCFDGFLKCFCHPN